MPDEALPPSQTADRLGFTITVPETWYELDLDPATRSGSIRGLVEDHVRGSQLWDQRHALVRLMEEQAERARAAGASYCAAFSMPTPAGPVTGSVTVSLVGDPMAGVEGALAGIAAGFVEVPRGEDPLAPYAETTTVDLPGTGSCPRTSGIEDADVGDGLLVRHAFMLTAVPLPELGKAFLVSASSPVLPLADTLLDLFDAVTSTFRVVRPADAD